MQDKPLRFVPSRLFLFALLTDTAVFSPLHNSTRRELRIGDVFYFVSVILTILYNPSTKIQQKRNRRPVICVASTRNQERRRQTLPYSSKIGSSFVSTPSLFSPRVYSNRSSAFMLPTRKHPYKPHILVLSHSCPASYSASFPRGKGENKHGACASLSLAKLSFARERSILLGKSGSSIFYFVISSCCFSPSSPLASHFRFKEGGCQSSPRRCRRR